MKFVLPGSDGPCPERWKPIRGFARRYFVSNLGRVASTAWGYAKVLRPHMVRPKPGSPLRYMYVGLKLLDKPTQHRAIHLLVLTHFTGKRPSIRHQGAHLDCNTLNNRLDNLVWATPKENSGHSQVLDRLARGERAPGAVLDAERVAEMRRLHATGEHSYSALARKYGVSKTHVKDIVKLKVWKHA